MKLDFTRDTFDATRHFLRVITQQGRVQLDADANEQVSILLHYLQTAMADLLGMPAGPAGRVGFAITPFTNEAGRQDFRIGAGHYYVDGILCENEAEITYFTQPDYPLFPAMITDHQLPALPFLVYLDVWERAMTGLEEPGIHEVALGGADTAARSKVVWQVKAVHLTGGADCGDMHPTWAEDLEEWQPAHRGLLRAQASLPDDNDLSNPCIASPDAHYRGAENQLYRVEIHTAGTAGENGAATFKWSRENGAVVFPIESYQGGDTVTLENLGPDTRFGLQVDDWVEIVDDASVLWGGALPYTPLLRQVRDIRIMDRIVTLSPLPTGVSSPGRDPNLHPLLRRWDQQATNATQSTFRDGAIRVQEPAAADNVWVELEDGVQIQFRPSDSVDHPNQYRTGDYWLIPARTATGDVDWPHIIPPSGGQARPAPLPPQGVAHHYATLAVVTGAEAAAECRNQFDTLAHPIPQ